MEVPSNTNQESHFMQSFRMNDEINLMQIFHIARKKIWLLLICAGVGFLMASLVAIRKTPVYTASALIQVNDQISSQSVLSGLGSLTGQVSKASPAQVQQALLMSRFILEPLITDLGLNISAAPKYMPYLGGYFSRHYKGEGVADPRFGFKHYAWGGEEIKVSQFNVGSNFLGSLFTLVAGENDGFKLFGPKHKFILGGHVGQLATSKAFPDTSILVTKLLSRPGVDFTVSKLSLPFAVDELQNMIDITEGGNPQLVQADTGILDVSLRWPKVEELPVILNKLITIAVNKNVEQKSREAGQSLHFIQQQLPKMQASLNTSEKALNDYRAQKGILDISAESKILLQQITDQESNLESLKIQKTSLLRLYTDQHPIIIGINKRIATLQENMGSLEKKIQTMPHADQKAITLMRDVKVKETLYASMLSKVQELKLMQAGTTGDVQILNYATNPPTILPMRRMVIVLAGIIGGLFMGMLYVIMRQVMIGEGSYSPEKIEQILGASICGMIPFSKKECLARKNKEDTSRFILAQVDSSDTSVEALRSFRTSLCLKNMKKSENFITMMGSAPGIGKSFVSLNMAYLLAETGRRVLLLDSDMRRGSQHKLLSVNKAPGLSDYCLNSKLEVKPHQITKHLDFISCGDYPSNPAELFLSSSFNQLVDELKKNYDVVIVDTPPILAVTDALLVAQHATANFMVIGLGKNALSESKVALNNMQKNEVRIDGLVCNYINRAAQDTSVTNYTYAYKR